MRHVLVLNRCWQAVNIVTARRAFNLLFQDHARVIYTDDDSFRVFNSMEWLDFSAQDPPVDESDSVRTVSYRVRLPRIILLNVFDRVPRKEIKFTRNNVFERDKNRCQYCGDSFDRTDLNLDHVIPRDYGGRTTWENVVCSCISCNIRKANRLPHEAGMRLIRKPHRPKWRPFVTIVMGNPAYEAWKHFLDAAYWNVELKED